MTRSLLILIGAVSVTLIAITYGLCAFDPGDRE